MFLLLLMLHCQLVLSYRHYFIMDQYYTHFLSHIQNTNGNLHLVLRTIIEWSSRGARNSLHCSFSKKETTMEAVRISDYRFSIEVWKVKGKLRMCSIHTVVKIKDQLYLEVAS